jgi:putative ABC transport system permease protein
MLVVSLFANDSIDYMINRHYYGEQHYDLLLRFTGPVKEKELLDISRLDGVLKTEPFFEIPVRLEYNGRTEEDILQGLPENLTLKEISGDLGAPLKLPPEGILINKKTAAKLGVRTGDRVRLETLLKLGPARHTEIKIASISTQLIGSGSYLSLELSNRIMRESGLVSGAMLKIQPGTERHIEEKLGAMTGISSITSRQKELDNFNKNLESMVYSISVMVVFAVMLGFAIVYNASVMSFTERKRELASLRVVGFTSQEVSGLLLKETLLQSLLGVALGLPLGLFMAQGYIQAVSTDLFTMQVVIYPLTYFFSALGGVFFIMMAHLLAARGVGRLDLVDVLKNRD